MPLNRLEIDDFRCIERASLALDSRYNLFVGENASGKTSLLEAIFFLGRGRSFRTRRLDRLVRQGRDEFRLVGWVGGEGPATVLGIAGSREGTEIRVGGGSAPSTASLAEHFPPQIIDPDVHKLLEDGPTRRRRFLDWGVFHVEHSFLDVWQRYHRALRQRNAALRQHASRFSIEAWDQELLQAGERLDVLRREYLAQLAEPLHAVGAALLGLEVTVAYSSGWATGEGASVQRSAEALGIRTDFGAVTSSRDATSRTWRPLVGRSCGGTGWDATHGLTGGRARTRKSAVCDLSASRTGESR